MAQKTLSSSTQTAINTALTSPSVANNVTAYKAIANEISTGGFNTGTVNWFNQAWLVNQQQVTSSAQGTYIYAFMGAAIASEGGKVTAAQEQAASNDIARAVFTHLKNNSYVFTDVPGAANNFAPASIVQDDAGVGLADIRDDNPGATLTNAIWGGTLFARTELNDPTYITDYGLDLTPGSKDCDAILAGYAGGAEAIIVNPSLWGVAFGGLTALDQDIINTCDPTEFGYDGTITNENPNGSVTVTESSGFNFFNGANNESFGNINSAHTVATIETSTELSDTVATGSGISVVGPTTDPTGWKLSMSGAGDTVTNFWGDSVLVMTGTGAGVTVDGGANTSGGGIILDGANQSISLGAANMWVDVNQGGAFDQRRWRLDRLQRAERERDHKRRQHCRFLLSRRLHNDLERDHR